MFISRDIEVSMEMNNDQKVVGGKWMIEPRKRLVLTKRRKSTNLKEKH